ncbi:MAG: hypothetical protein IIC36_05030 [Gemmatimonadetes bacterium]|nr:hypothetical protein [Gemmatimonadota bacterium]
MWRDLERVESGCHTSPSPRLGGSRSLDPGHPRPAFPLLLTVGFVLVGGLLASCGPDAETDPGEPADSGVTYDIVEELRIDGYEHNLVPIDTTIRVAVAENGMIAIAQLQTSNVLFFSETGESLGSIGRDGEGPGEFRKAWRLGWIADTLYVYDFSLRRFTLIDPDLQYVRYIYVPNGARPGPEMAGRLPEFGIVYGGALYADGSVYGQFAGTRNAVANADFDPQKTTYGRVREDGTIVSYFQFSSGGGEPIRVRLDQGTVLMNSSLLPSPERPILRLSSDGIRMAHLSVAMEGPDAGTFEIKMEDVFTGVLYVRRYPFDPVPITQAVRDSILEVRLEDMPPEMARALRGGATFPPMLPPVVGMVGGRDNTLWIRMRDTAEGRPYRILDPSGEPVGTLTLPLNSRIAAADLHQIWVIEIDELDVESVVRYRLQIASKDAT